MISATGTPADAPPLPWGKYLLALIGFPFRQRKVWDDDPKPDPHDSRRPT
jgi:hypothetical protein